MTADPPPLTTHGSRHPQLRGPVRLAGLATILLVAGCTPAVPSAAIASPSSAPPVSASPTTTANPASPSADLYPSTSASATIDGLVVLVVGPNGASLIRYEGGHPKPVPLPEPDVTLISSGGGMLLAVTRDGAQFIGSFSGAAFGWAPAKTPTVRGLKDPLRLGLLSPDGSRIAAVAFDPVRGPPTQVVVWSVRGGPPSTLVLAESFAGSAWLGGDRIVVQANPFGAVGTHVLTAPGLTESTDPLPWQDAWLSADADGSAIASVGEHETGVRVRATSEWLSHSPTSAAEEVPAPAGDAVHRIALDGKGSRLAVAWSAVSTGVPVALAVYDRAAAWRNPTTLALEGGLNEDSIVVPVWLD